MGLTVAVAVVGLLAVGWTLGARLGGASASPGTAPVGVSTATAPATTAPRRGVVSVFRPTTTTEAVVPVAPVPDPLGAAMMVDVAEPAVPTTPAAPPVLSAAATPAAATTTSAATTTTAAPPIRRITGVGDSIMLGAAERLSDEVANRLGAVVEIDARVGRPFGEGIDVAHELVAAGRVGDAVVVHLGTNGPIDDAMVRELLDDFRTVRLVVLVNVRVPRAYEAPVNETLAVVGATYPNVRLVDWYGATEGQPELFWADGVHLRAAGNERYARLLAEALAA